MTKLIFKLSALIIGNTYMHRMYDYNLGNLNCVTILYWQYLLFFIYHQKCMAKCLYQQIKILIYVTIKLYRNKIKNYCYLEIIVNIKIMYQRVSIFFDYGWLLCHYVVCQLLVAYWLYYLYISSVHWEAQFIVSRALTPLYIILYMSCLLD